MNKKYFTIGFLLILISLFLFLILNRKEHFYDTTLSPCSNSSPLGFFPFDLQSPSMPPGPSDTLSNQYVLVKNWNNPIIIYPCTNKPPASDIKKKICIGQIKFNEFQAELINTFGQTAAPTEPQFIKPSKDNPVSKNKQIWGCYQVKFFVDPTKLNLPAGGIVNNSYSSLYKKNINQRFFRFYQSPWSGKDTQCKGTKTTGNGCNNNQKICANYAYNLYIKPPFPTVKCSLTKCGKSPSCPKPTEGPPYVTVKKANHVEWSAVRNNCKGQNGEVAYDWSYIGGDTWNSSIHEGACASKREVRKLCKQTIPAPDFKIGKPFYPDKAYSESCPSSNKPPSGKPTKPPSGKPTKPPSGKPTKPPSGKTTKGPGGTTHKPSNTTMKPIVGGITSDLIFKLDPICDTLN